MVPCGYAKQETTVTHARTYLTRYAKRDPCISGNGRQSISRTPNVSDWKSSALKRVLLCCAPGDGLDRFAWLHARKEAQCEAHHRSSAKNGKASPNVLHKPSRGSCHVHPARKYELERLADQFIVLSLRCGSLWRHSRNPLRADLSPRKPEKLRPGFVKTFSGT